MPIVRTLDHVGIMVSDLERSLRFYHDVLGLEFVSSEEHNDGPISEMTATPGVHMREYRLRPGEGVNGHARLEGPGFTFDLLEWVAPKSPSGRFPINQVPSAHICFGVDDLAAAYERLQRENVECVSPPVRFEGEGDWHVLFAYDPDGNLVELNEIGAGSAEHHQEAERHSWSRY
jgi:catechol 2,3-dioxygenase-like lactoylglutathione lyase family enzyme